MADLLDVLVLILDDEVGSGALEGNHALGVLWLELLRNLFLLQYLHRGYHPTYCLRYENEIPH